MEISSIKNILGIESTEQANELNEQLVYLDAARNTRQIPIF